MRLRPRCPGCFSGLSSTDRPFSYFSVFPRSSPSNHAPDSRSDPFGVQGVWVGVESIFSGWLGSPSRVRVPEGCTLGRAEATDESPAAASSGPENRDRHALLIPGPGGVCLVPNRDSSHPPRRRNSRGDARGEAHLPDRLAFSDDDRADGASARSPSRRPRPDANAPLDDRRGCGTPKQRGAGGPEDKSHEEVDGSGRPGNEEHRRRRPSSPPPPSKGASATASSVTPDPRARSEGSDRRRRRSGERGQPVGGEGPQGDAWGDEWDGERGPPEDHERRASRERWAAGDEDEKDGEGKTSALDREELARGGHGTGNRRRRRVSSSSSACSSSPEEAGRLGAPSASSKEKSRSPREGIAGELPCRAQDKGCGDEERTGQPR